MGIQEIQKMADVRRSIPTVYGGLSRSQGHSPEEDYLKTYDRPVGRLRWLKPNPSRAGPIIAICDPVLVEIIGEEISKRMAK